jgi:hypothetical protein
MARWVRNQVGSLDGEQLYGGVGGNVWCLRRVALGSRSGGFFMGEIPSAKKDTIPKPSA